MPAQRVRLLATLLAVVALAVSGVVVAGTHMDGPQVPGGGMRFGDYMSAPTPHADEELDPQAAQVYRAAAELWSVAGVGVPTLASHVTPSCTGTGTDGKRIQAAYIRGASQPDTYAASSARILERLREIDDVFAASAAKTGGGLRVRWVTDAACTPVVENIVLSDQAMRDWSAYYAELRSYGWSNPDRKYLGFTTGNAYCGLAELPGDDRSSKSQNEVGPHMSRIDAPCWNQAPAVTTAAHELAHMLGAVNGSTPNSTGLGHCTDDADVMCYDDGGPKPRTVCPIQEEFLLDCNNDDYLHMSPPAGSYLATHWNLASSPFLDVVAPLPPAPQVTVSAKEATGQQVALTIRAGAGDAVEAAATPAGCNVVTAAPNDKTTNGNKATKGKKGKKGKQPGRQVSRSGRGTMTTTGVGAVTVVYDCNLKPGATREFTGRAVSADAGRVAVATTSVVFANEPGRLKIPGRGRKAGGTAWTARLDLGPGKARKARWTASSPCRIDGPKNARKVTVSCRDVHQQTFTTVRARVDFPWRPSIHITKTVFLRPARR